MSRRIILLGASNLNMGLPRIVNALESAFDGPLEIFSAPGHGRSFGLWSRILHRELPGIVNCGLWQAMESGRDRPAATLGLITDVGNDLLYDVDVPQIAEWVETCLTRMKNHGADVVITSLPIDTVERLGSRRYYATRAFFFPNSRVSFTEIRRRAAELNARLIELGQRHAATVIELPGAWYGFDPIHFRHTRRREAWSRILSRWSGFPDDVPTGAASPAAWCRLFRAHPQTRRVFGRERITRQPAIERGRLSVSLF